MYNSFLSPKKVLQFFILIAVFVLSAGIVQSQEVHYGKEQRFNFREGKYDIIGRVGDRIMTYRTQDQKHYLDLYNDSMAHKASVELDFMPKKTTYINFCPNDQYLTVFYRVEEKGEVNMYGTRLDDKGMILGKPQIIARHKSSWFGFKRHQWTAVVSEDKSKVAILAKGGKDKADLQMLLVTAQLDTIYATTKTLVKYDIIDEIVLEYAVLSNDGNLAIPAYKQSYSSLMKSAGILMYSPPLNADSVILYPIAHPRYHLSDFTLKVDNERHLFRIAGLAQEQKRSSSSATLLMDIGYLRDHPGDSARYVDHPEAYLKILSSKGWKKAMYQHKVKEAVFVNDGSVIMITEFQRVEERNNYNGTYLGYDPYYAHAMDMTTARNTTEHHYGDIAIMYYDNKDVLAWSEFVRKTQISQDDDGAFSSYAFMNTGGSLVMLFNNFGRTNSSIGISAINKSGQIQLANYSELAAKSDWAMNAGKQISLREIIIPSFKRNNIAFNRIVF